MNKRFLFMMLLGLITLFFLFNFHACSEKEKVVIEISKQQASTGGLGTMDYEPTSKEIPFFRKLTKKKTITTQKDWNNYGNTLLHRTGEYISWFGIFRGIDWDKKKNISELLIEMKYFDGLTDLHLQVVSLYGAGDFKIVLPRRNSNIPKLSLIRVYGTVINEIEGLPIVKPEYIRVWDWGLFAFMDYGKDISNPKWIEMRKIKYQRIYSSRPDKKYYEDRLGSRDNLNQKQLYKTEMFDSYFYDHFFRSSFFLEKSLKPILKLIKNNKYAKALKQLEKLKPIWKNDTKRSHLWSEYFLCQIKIYLGLGQKENAIASLLHSLKLSSISSKDQFQIWGFLSELGYNVPEEMANEVIGVIVEIPSPPEQAEGKYKLTVFKDGDTTLDKSSKTGFSSLGFSNRHSDKFKNDVEEIINTAQHNSHIFSIAKDPFAPTKQELFESYFESSPTNSTPILKFSIFTPKGKREYETLLLEFNKNHDLSKLHSLAVILIKKIEKSNEK